MADDPFQCISSRFLLEIVFDPDHSRPVEDIGETIHLCERRRMSLSFERW